MSTTVYGVDGGQVDIIYTGVNLSYDQEQFDAILALIADLNARIVVLEGSGGSGGTIGLYFNSPVNSGLLALLLEDF